MKKFLQITLLTGLVSLMNIGSVFAMTDTGAEAAGLAVGGGVLLFTAIISIISVIIPFFLSILLLGVSVVGIIAWVWMLIDLLQREEKDFPDQNMKDQKLIWILVLVLTSYIGAAIYYFMVYKKAQSTIKK